MPLVRTGVDSRRSDLHRANGAAEPAARRLDRPRRDASRVPPRSAANNAHCPSRFNFTSFTTVCCFPSFCVLGSNSNRGIESDAREIAAF
jgi:hypothetical protein